MVLNIDFRSSQLQTKAITSSIGENEDKFRKGENTNFISLLNDILC